MRKNRSGSLQKCGTYGKRSIIYDPVCDLWQITKNKFWFKSDHTNTFRILKFVFRFDKKKSEKKLKVSTLRSSKSFLEALRELIQQTVSSGFTKRTKTIRTLMNGSAKIPIL